MSETFTLTQDMSNQTVDTYLYPEGDLSGCTEFTSYASNGEGNYSCVDENREIPDDDDTYVYWNQEAIGVDLYELASKKNFGVINYIQVYSRAKSTDNPQAPEGTYKIICSLDSACTVVYKSDDVNLTTGYKTYYKVWTENPATSIAWSWGDINLLCIGEECSSPTYTTTQTLTIRPNADISKELYSLCTPNHYPCVAYETPSDIIEESIFSDADNPLNTETDIFSLPNHTTESGVITKISFFWRIQKGNNKVGIISGKAILRDTVNVADNNTTLSFTTNWTTSSSNYTTNPATGVAWTWAEVDGFRLGIEFTTESTPEGAIITYLYCNQLYIVVQYNELAQSEIRTTQCYAKVNSSPSDTVCELNFPEEVSTNHSRNVKMMNMWNGNREVYDLNRSGKSMLLTGKEIDYECTQEAKIYYFDDYDVGEAFDHDPEYMVDNNLATWAYGTQDVQKLTSNTCSVDDDTVPKKVEIRAYVRGAVITANNPWIKLRPIFTTGDGSDFEYKGTISTAQWTDWYDITNDVNAPTSWTWADVRNLQCDVISNVPFCIGCSDQCAKVEIRVTHNGEAVQRIQCVRNMGIVGADIVIDDFSFDAFNGTYKIKSFGWDIISKSPTVYSWILELEDAEL